MIQDAREDLVSGRNGLEQHQCASVLSQMQKVETQCKRALAARDGPQAERLTLADQAQPNGLVVGTNGTRFAPGTISTWDASKFP